MDVQIESFQLDNITKMELSKEGAIKIITVQSEYTIKLIALNEGQKWIDSLKEISSRKTRKLTNNLLYNINIEKIGIIL